MDYYGCNYNYDQLHQYEGDVPTTNRFVYVNQNFHKPPTVLVNPNFKKTVHINPNFKGTIHVNPNVIKLQDLKPNCDNNLSNISNLKDNLKPNLKPSNLKSEVRNIKSPLNRRRSVHTKYKIVHVENGENSSKLGSSRLKHGVKSKYKIDKRNVADKKRNCTKIMVKTRFKLKNVTVSKGKFVNINGVLYKKTPNVLKKANLNLNSSETQLKKLKIKVNGKIYKLNNSFSNSNRNLNKKRLLLSQTKNFIKQVFMSKMKKCNVPCPIYKKFGKCYAKIRGKCFRTHNPDQIDLCTRFLQGACRKKNCLLSHKVSAEKMPTCKYYLEGLCTREDCPYLHVKISPKADICKDFLEGFCKRAKECDKRHQFLCPDYEKNGSCPRKRCQYPHGNTVRKYSLKAKATKRNIKLLKAKIEQICTNKDKRNKKEVEKKVRYYLDSIGNQDLLKTTEILNNINDKNHKNENKSNKNEDKKSKNDEINDLNVSDDDEPIYVYKRKTLGDLPSFIPLGE